jgi:enamine deaminase RidA (YjgF/YER057c/UK114 family)
VGDFDAQARRMLVNIAALLERQGANFRDVVSAITYLKDNADAPRLRRVLDEEGFGGFPHALVEAEVCRPDLLCETEALAVVPVAG